MVKKQSSNYSSEAQAEKRIRGESFQEEIRRSWSLIPNCWRMRITDDCGSRPADEIVILPHVNFLIEMKRKASDRLNLADLRTNQLSGLMDFEKAGDRNKGIVIVSFLNETSDFAYAVGLRDLLLYLNKMSQMFITQSDLASNLISFDLPRIEINEQRGYDLRRLVDWFK